MGVGSCWLRIIFLGGLIRQKGVKKCWMDIRMKLLETRATLGYRYSRARFTLLWYVYFACTPLHVLTNENIPGPITTPTLFSQLFTGLRSISPRTIPLFITEPTTRPALRYILLPTPLRLPNTCRVHRASIQRSYRKLIRKTKYRQMVPRLRVSYLHCSFF